MIADL
jgi:hypothetical protein